MFLGDRSSNIVVIFQVSVGKYVFCFLSQIFVLTHFCDIGSLSKNKKHYKKLMFIWKIQNIECLLIGFGDLTMDVYYYTLLINNV